MEILKICFSKIGHLFLGVFAAFRRALCCLRKRRRSSDFGLPVTSIEVSSASAAKFENCDLQDWEVWNEADGPTSITVETTNKNNSSNTCHRTTERQNSIEDEENNDVNFFQDMTPAIRRAKKYKLVARGIERNNDDQVQNGSENRFGVNIQAAAYHTTPDLGYLEDDAGLWEDISPEDMFNPDILIREQRLAEREKRLAEHKRRKNEREAKRQEPFSPTNRS